MLKGLCGLVGGAALSFIDSARAAVRDPRVVLPPDASGVRALMQALRQHHPGLQADADPATFDPRRAGLTVAIGPLALRKAIAADGHGPLLSVLCSSQAFRRQLHITARDPSATSALYAEAPPLAQMQLISALFERRVTVGILLSEASSYLDKPLRQAAQAFGLDVQVLQTAAGQDPVRLINDLSSSQVLLAVPDATLYTPDTLRAVLESTYRRGLPVIGFSPATVAAGTLACAHVDLDDLSADLIEVLDGLPATGSPLPEARYPRYWRVSVNDNVARSLGLAITDRVRNLGARPGGRTP